MNAIEFTYVQEGGVMTLNIRKPYVKVFKFTGLIDGVRMQTSIAYNGMTYNILYNDVQKTLYIVILETVMNPTFSNKT